jgi:succinate dehydrogenase / fumarate reductase, cytochrome b subunit
MCFVLLSERTAMSWFRRTLDSSIGGKLIVAVTGLGLVGFILAHLTGNLLIFAGREALAEYAEGLRKFPALLWGMRAGLIAMAVVHIGFTIKLNRANKVARPVGYAKKSYKRATFVSRSMVLSGLTLLVYAIYHLLHFTFRTTNAEIGSLGAYDVYDMLIIGFSSPLISLFYIVAMILLGMHLSHGISSLFQTIGINNHKYNRVIRSLGPIAGALLALGYISIPVAVMTGFVTR